MRERGLSSIDSFVDIVRSRCLYCCDLFLRPREVSLDDEVWNCRAYAGSMDVIVLSPEDFANSLLMNRPVGCSYW